MKDPSDRDDHTASEEEEEEEELHESSESAESSSEESVNAGALLDLEASESGDEDEDDDDDDDDNNDDGGMNIESHDNYHHSFPQFCRLPIELRQRIWEFFDPDLRASARVFDVHFVGDCLWPSGTLDQQTAPARVLLEVHHESRQMGLKFYPDKLPMLNRKGSLRYHKDRDIIFLGWMSNSMDWDPAGWRPIADDLKHVKNLAFEVKPDIHLLQVFGDLPFHTFASLQKVYPCWDAYELHSRDLKWCVSDSVHVFRVETEEEEPDLGEDLEFLYCWPDLKDHLEYAEREIPKDLRLGRTTDGDDKPGIELWPMVLFSSHDGVRRYQRLREKALADPDAAWDSESSSESEEGSSEPDEYESEGIDDDTIDESDDNDDDEDNDDLVVQDSSEDEVEGGSGFHGFASYDGRITISGGVQPVAQFSSLEPESPKNNNSDDSDEDEDEDEEPVVANKRSRRRVVSSDSEDDSALEPEAGMKKQSRQTNRRAGPVVLSDSDDSEEDENDGAKTKGKESGSEESDATADDDSAEESDEEQDIPKKPMSLTERLRLYRSENPVPQDGSESASNDAGSEIFHQNADDDDGLLEGVDYDDDKDGSENDLVMNMAEDEFDDGDDDGW